MPTPDVRVRLSAEGTAEVIAALKKVQAEGVKSANATGVAAKKGAGGVGSLTASLGGLKGILGAAGIAVGFAQVTGQLRGLATQSLDAAGNLADLSEAFGTSGANLSTLAAAGAKSGVSIEQIGKALSKTAVLTTEFENGSASAARTLRALGITIEDLKGKDTAERFALIADRLSKMRDSAAKADLTIKAFGERLGSKFIPLVNEVGTKGLPVLRAELEKLGFVMSDKVIANVDRLGDTLARSQGQIVVLGSNFLAGVAGPVVQGLELQQEALGTTTNLLQVYGNVFGIVIRTLLLVPAAMLPVLSTFDSLVTVLRLAKEHLVAYGKMATLIVSGQFGELAAVQTELDSRAKAILDSAYERHRKRHELAKSARKAIFSGVSGFEVGAAAGAVLSEAEKRALEDQRRDLARKMLDLDKSISDSQLKLQENANRRAFESGLLDLEKYYAQRRALVAKALEAELEYIESVRRSELGNAATTEQRAGINEAARKSSDNRRDQATDQYAELGVLFQEDKLRLASKVLDVQRESLDLLGRESEIRAAIFAHQVAAHRLAAEQAGFRGAELDAETELFAKGLQLTEDFNRMLQGASRALADFDRARTTVQRESLTARLSEVESAKRLVEFDAARVPALREAANALTQIAQASGNQDLTERALGFSDSISQLEGALEAASVAASTFRDVARSAFESGLQSFLSEGINDVRSLEDAFHRLARSIIADIQRISAQRISKSITDLFSGAFSGGLNSGQQTLLHAARLVGFADGGFVAGPGTGRSDSVPAMLSRGEFVVQSSVASQPGIAELLMNLNNGYDLRPPSFAPIVYDDGDFSGGGSSSVNGAITVSADEGSTITHLDTPAGQKVVLKHIVNNRRAIGRILGGR